MIYYQINIHFKFQTRQNYHVAIVSTREWVKWRENRTGANLQVCDLTSYFFILIICPQFSVFRHCFIFEISFCIFYTLSVFCKDSSLFKNNWLRYFLRRFYWWNQICSSIPNGHHMGQFLRKCKFSPTRSEISVETIKLYFNSI